MIKKRSRFWTIVFALLPGAGHMFNGFMKRGLSLMSLFSALFLLMALLRLGAVGVLMPVVWFYAFFDCINIRFQDDEEFYNQEDEYLFSLQTLLDYDFEGYTQGRRKKIVGTVLVVSGVYILWHNIIFRTIINLRFLPSGIYHFLSTLNRVIPQAVVAVLIIWLGWNLIRGKKQELLLEAEEEEHDQ